MPQGQVNHNTLMVIPDDLEKSNKIVTGFREISVIELRII